MPTMSSTSTKRMSGLAIVRLDDGRTKHRSHKKAESLGTLAIVLTRIPQLGYPGKCYPSQAPRLVNQNRARTVRLFESVIDRKCPITGN